MWKRAITDAVAIAEKCLTLAAPGSPDRLDLARPQAAEVEAALELGLGAYGFLARVLASETNAEADAAAVKLFVGAISSPGSACAHWCSSFGL